MKFEPLALITLAARNGIQVWKNGEMVGYRGPAAGVSLWLEAIRIHKWAILPHLPEGPPNP